MTDEVTSTQRFFKQLNIKLSDEWLESCIQWYKEENPTCTKETLHLNVFQQWLLLNLQEVPIPVLPPTINEAQKLVLSNTYSVQVMKIIDISKPKLWQIQNLRNSTAPSNATDLDTTTSHSKRMLQLTLTDGCTTVEAIEYKPIACLNINLPPGTKIRISGPVTCRRGQIFLEEKHVKVLGGEVEEIVVENAAENVLARALNLPLNLQPVKVKDDFEAATQDLNRARNQNITSTAPIRNINPSDNYKATTSSQIGNCISNTSTLGRRIVKTESATPVTQKASLVQNINATSIQTVATTTSNTNFFSEEEEMQIMAKIDLLLETEQALEKETAKKTSTFEDNLIEDDFFEFSQADDVQEPMEVDQPEVMPISQLCDVNSGQFTVRAKFKTVMNKLSMTAKAWTLKIKVGDEMGDLDAMVHSDLITRLARYSPADMMVLKSEVLKGNQSAKETVLKIIEGLKQKIMNLDCLMKITYTDKEPTIVELK